MQSISVLVVDDHPAICSGLRDLEKLSSTSKISIVGQAASGEEGIALVKKLDPDIVLMDISLRGEMNGVVATTKLLAERPSAKVIFYTFHTEPIWLKKFAQSGAYGYVDKATLLPELARGIEEVYAGKRFVSACESVEKTTGPKASLQHGLTTQEEIVLRNIAMGKTSEEIALEMCVSVHTVGKYRQNLAAKLDLHTIADVVKYAVFNGWLADET